MSHRPQDAKRFEVTERGVVRTNGEDKLLLVPLGLMFC
jgi:hypothetical protein